MTKITTMALETYDSSTEIELPSHQYAIVKALRNNNSCIVQDKYFKNTFTLEHRHRCNPKELYYNDVYALIYRGFIDAITLELTDFGKTVNCYWYEYKLTYNTDKTDVVKSEKIKHFIN